MCVCPAIPAPFFSVGRKASPIFSYAHIPSRPECKTNGSSPVSTVCMYPHVGTTAVYDSEYCFGDSRQRRQHAHMFQFIPQKYIFRAACGNRFETAINHVVELGASWLLLAPVRLLCMLGGGIQTAFQLAIIVSGNLSFLNHLTILPFVWCFDDRRARVARAGGVSVCIGLPQVRLCVALDPQV